MALQQLLPVFLLMSYLLFQVVHLLISSLAKLKKQHSFYEHRSETLFVRGKEVLEFTFSIFYIW